MTDQPAAQPPHLPPPHPGAGNPATQPNPGAGSPWGQAAFTHPGRWAIAIGAGFLATVLLLGAGLVGLAFLRYHDRLILEGSGPWGYSRAQGGHPHREYPQQPGMPGGGAQGQDGQDGQDGLGGLGGLLGGTALHGNVTADVNGATRSLVFQRGEVTAVSATSITLRSTDGFTGTYGRDAATTSMRAVPVKGGHALVLARASDKVAITILSTPAGAGVGPSS